MTIRSIAHEQCVRLAAKWSEKTRFERQKLRFYQVIDIVNSDDINVSIQRYY